MGYIVQQSLCVWLGLTDLSVCVLTVNISNQKKVIPKKCFGEVCFKSIIYFKYENICFLKVLGCTKSRQDQSTQVKGFAIGEH